jgi:hypothetical protein
MALAQLLDYLSIVILYSLCFLIINCMLSFYSLYVISSPYLFIFFLFHFCRLFSWHYLFSFFLFANILEFFLFDNHIISYLLLVCYVSLLANFVSYMYCWIVPTFISAFVTFISYMHEHHPFSSFFFFFFFFVVLKPCLFKTWP